MALPIQGDGVDTLPAFAEQDAAYLADAGRHFRRYSPELVIDDNNGEVMKALVLYFRQDRMFETEGHGSLKKGIFLVGPVGVGKTFLMKLLLESVRFETRVPYRIESAFQVAEKYQSDGMDTLNKIIPEVTGIRSIDNPYNNRNLLFDDFGVEPTQVSYMGTRLNPMEFVISRLYDRYSDRFSNIHFTSNLNKQMIEEAYGTRIYSRLREMTNLILLNGPDRRAI